MVKITMVHSEWDVHRAEIEHIYLKESKSLKELRQFMETTYGFRKTKYQYEATFKKWGIKKYRMGAEKWKYVKRQIEKRNSQQKCTEVYIDGVLCPQKTVQTEVHRQGFEREIEKYYEAPSPKTPEGIIVCSPGPSALQHLWPPNLPWFIFSNVAPMALGSITDNTSLSLTGLSNFQEGDKSRQLVSRGLFSALSSLFTGDQANLFRTFRSGSRVASALSSIMPEQHEGQNMYIAECLSRLGGGGDIVECLQVALFLISNNFRIGESNEWSKMRSRVSEVDRTIMAVFHMPGLNTIQSFRHLLSVPGVTAQAMAQKLFASAVTTRDLQTVRMVLKAGMSPDTPVLHHGRRTSPLILAAQTRDSAVALEMSHLLLSHNAGFKEPKVLEQALFHAIKSENQELVKTFLSTGAHITAESLEAAIETEIPGLFQILLDVDCDVNKRTGNSPTAGYTILRVAVEKNDIPLTKKLLALGAEVDELQSVTIQEEDQEAPFLTTALRLAVKKGNDEMVNHLLAAQANVNHETTTDGYIPPLVLAVENGHKSVTQHLLAAGVDINISDATLGKTLIQRALDRHDLEMSRMLMANGASVDRKLMEDYYTSELYTKVELGDLYTVALLLSWGAKVDEIHNEVPDTVLGAAISSGNCEMIQTLLQAEAKNTGRILIKIGNLKTAKYLEQLGMLPDILLLCGKHILVSAIHEEPDRRGDGLVQYLLDHDVDRQVQPLELSAEFHTRLLDFSQSPLEEAINCQNVPLAKALVERGAPVTDFELTVAVQVYRCHRNYDFLSLLLCTLSQNPCAVPGAFVEAMQSDLTVCLIQRFLDAGLDPQGKSAYKPQVLEQAVTYLNGSTLKTLLQVTTWTAMEKGRALTVSLYYGHKHLVQDLLDAQADVNQVIGENTPLFLAVKMEDASLTRRLISAGANLNWLEVGYGPTILESAVYIGNKQIVKVLLDAGADVNHPASLRWGHTSLQIAVKEGDIQLVDMLLDAGADVNQPASRVGGQTALQIAVQEGNVQLVNILLDAGADVNQEPAKDRGATALQFAAIQGYIGIAHKLLDRGADVNAAKSIYHGRSALEGAAEHGRIDMLQLLLNERASIEGPGRIQYIRAIKLAEKLTNYAAAQLLRDHGGWNDSNARQYEHELFDRDEQINIKGRFKNGG